MSDQLPEDDAITSELELSELEVASDEDAPDTPYDEGFDGVQDPTADPDQIDKVTSGTQEASDA